jgi:hypothetical protein
MTLPTYLLDLAVKIEPLWASYEFELRLLTDYAVEFRYPGAFATLTNRFSLGLKE